MSQLTLGKIPGFVDIPDNLLAAEKFAMGLNLQRVLGNAKFGIVRPEFFTGYYKHGDTVELPVSPVDAYTYQRDELIYLWHYVWTGGVASSTDNGVSTFTTQKPTGPGTIWYFGAFVDQATGAVESWVKYRESTTLSTAKMSNDGLLEVITIGVRRKDSLIVSAALPAWSDIANADLAQDKAITQAIAQTLSHNAKLSSLSHEAVYMGEFTHGQQIPRPLSPCDGYRYSYGEVTWAWCWRWTTAPDEFADPQEVVHGIYNQLDRLQASIDGSGNVSVEVDYYDSGVFPSSFGRIAVVALCARRPLAVSQPANVFSDIANQDMMSGAFPRYDVLQALSAACRFGALRVEYFDAGTFTNAQQVPLPTSPVDGYTYSREELMYICDFSNTGPNTYIRIQSCGGQVDRWGTVSLTNNHLKDGGAYRATYDGSVHVTVVARRSHVQPAVTDPGLVLDTGSSGDPDAVLYNGNFESWTVSGAPIADCWTRGTQSGGATAQQDPGIEGNSAQGFIVPIGGAMSIYSSKLAAKQLDLRYCGLKMASAVATTRGFFFRIHLYNADLANSAYFDILADQAMLGGGALQSFDLWYEVPPKNATTANTSRGAAAIVGTYDFVCSYSKIELLVSNPNVAVHLTLDAVSWSIQANPAAGQVAQRGVSALAFFPAIQISVTDTTATVNLNVTLERIDGSQVVVAQGNVVITGLTAATQYALELYYDEILRIITAIAGGAGSNGWAHSPADMSANARTLAVAWHQASHLPLSDSPIYFTTNSAPTDPPGGYYGGGDGGCHRVDVLVRECRKGVIRHDQIEPGDYLLSKDGLWIPVLSVRRHVHHDWIHVDLSNGVMDLPMTEGHTWESFDDGDLRACELSMQTLLSTPEGRCSPLRIERKKYLGEIVEVALGDPHTYFVSMDGEHWVLSHNLIPYSTL